MWTNIYWIYFDNQELHHYIRNGSNTDNWPTVKKFGEILAEFKQKIEGQKKDNEKLIEVNKRVKELINTIQEWFKEEYDFLSDPRNAHLRDYEQEDLKPYFTETDYEKFKEFEEEWNIKIEEEIDLNEPPAENSQALVLANQSLVLASPQQGYLEQWFELNEGQQVKDNPYQVYIHERKQGAITFSWKVPERKFYNLSNYLFYFYGEWMMPADWQQTDYAMVKITAGSSIFYNRYWYFLKSGANGVLKHSPLARIEACHCLASPNISVYADFAVEDYELDLRLWRLKGGLNALGAVKGLVPGNKPPIFSVSQLEQISPSDNDFEAQMGALWDTAVGGVFFLLGNRFSGVVSTPNWFYLAKFKQQVREWLNSSGMNLVSDQKYDHVLRNHITATIYWRNKHIWQGNYWLLHNDFRIYEMITNAGNTITFISEKIILTKITENVTMKVGGNNIINKFFEVIVDTSLNDDKGQNNRQTERKILKAEKEFAKPTLYSIDHTKSEYTFMQFMARWGGSDNGDYPIKIRLNLNEDCLNDYKNSRELKGKHSNQYFNTTSIANFLSTPGYLQAQIISSNYPFGDWFTAKIASGVYLYDKEPLEFYQKKLSNPLSIPSKGDLRGQPFEVITITNTVSAGSGWDNISHCGGGFWVYKSKGGRENYIRVIGGSYNGTNLLGWLMATLNNNHSSLIVKEDSNKWILKHPDPTFHNYRVDIPDHYKWKTLENGQKAVQIHYLLDFFSGGEESNPKSEINATHFLVSKLASGNQSKLTIEIKGSHTIRNTVGDPAGIPPITPLRGSNVEPELPDPDPFDPEANIDPNVSEPSPDVPIGEPEPSSTEPDPVPDIDPSPDVPEPDLNEPDVTDFDPTPDLGDYDNKDYD